MGCASIPTEDHSGRANATILRPSVAVCLSSSVTLCIVAKLCVLEQKLLLRAYRKLYYGESISTKMNDVGRGCIKIMSAIASHSPLNISETVTE